MRVDVGPAQCGARLEERGSPPSEDRGGEDDLTTGESNYEEPLTGLLDLRGLDRELFRERARADRSGGRLAAALIVVEGLPRLARMLGPEGVCRARKELGARIASAVRPTDAVGHPTGTEFLVVFGCARLAEARRVGGRLVAALAGAPLPFEHAPPHLGHAVAVIDVSCSLPTADAVLARARLSLDASRADGREPADGPLVASGATTLFLSRAELERGMASVRATGSGRSLARQPIVDLATGSVVGHEYLTRGALGPHDTPGPLFRRAAERGELEALDLACLQSVVASVLNGAATEAQAKRGERPAALHVNLFPATLAARTEDVCAELRAAAQAGLACVVELDEQELPADPADLEPAVWALRETGVRIALDRVAPHDRALEALLLLRPDLLKPDRELLRDAGRHPGQWRSLLRLARAAERLGAEVSAVGVEDEAQRVLAREAGARTAQGFFLGRPVPVRA